MRRWLYRLWLRMRRRLRGTRRREIAMKLETLDTLTEIRQLEEEKLRDSGEWQLETGSIVPGPSSLANDQGRRTKDSPPVLDAYEDGTCWRVWCRYCRHWHSHGRGAGHRVAHCIVAESPYRQTGYTLRYAGVFTEAMRRKSH